MNFETRFYVAVDCKKYPKDVQDPSMTGDNVTLKLPFSKQLSLDFISRFESDIIDVGGLKLAIRIINGEFKGISLFSDEYVYIVKDPNYLISEVTKGYEKMIVIDKVQQIMDFDFEASVGLFDDNFDNDTSDITDEFE